jgi:hypothetical protein
VVVLLLPPPPPPPPPTIHCKILITASKKQNVVQVKFDSMAANKPIILTDKTNYILVTGL